MGIISLLGDLNLCLAFLIWYQGDTPFRARDQASGPVEITGACEAATVSHIQSVWDITNDKVLMVVN